MSRGYHPLGFHFNWNGCMISTGIKIPTARLNPEQSLTIFHLRKRNVLDSQKRTRLQQQVLHHPVGDVAAPLRSRELKHTAVSSSSLRTMALCMQKVRWYSARVKGGRIIIQRTLKNPVRALLYETVILPPCTKVQNLAYLAWKH